MSSSYSKGHTKHYLYYHCRHSPGLSFSGDLLHQTLDEVLTGLSFTAEQLTYIRSSAQSKLSEVLRNRTISLNEKTEGLKRIDGKLDKLEERYMNEEIELVTYKKGFSKLSSEKAFLQSQVQQLSASNQEKWGVLDEVFYSLTDLKSVYEKSESENKAQAAECGVRSWSRI